MMPNNILIEEMVDDLANGFKEMLSQLDRYDERSEAQFRAAIRDDIVMVVTILHKHILDFDVQRFYTMAGYTGIHPVTFSLSSSYLLPSKRTVT